MMSMHRISQDDLPLKRSCLHCGLIVPQGCEDVYCCHGCRSAHNLITKLNLNAFYDFLPKEGPSVIPQDLKRSDYSIFDSHEFQSGFIAPVDDTKCEAHFFLNGMTCYACVWVCEQVTRKMNEQASLSINMTTGEASLIFPKEGLALSEYIKAFESLGYAVTPNRMDGKEKQAGFERLGVAFFCLMNVMMLAIPEYLGTESLDPHFRNIFRMVSCALAAVSIFYCAMPFLGNALLSLKKRTLHLDLPIGLALLVGFGYSTFNMYRGSSHVYFDSMTAVVALLLTGRFFQARAIERILREQARFLEADVQFVRVVKSGDKNLIPLAGVKKGESFHVLPGEIIPLRSEMLSPCGDVNYGLLKGESESQTVNEGDEVLAGAMNGSSAIDLIAKEDGADSFLLQLQVAAQKLYQNKGRYLTLSEKMAKFFVIFTLAAAFGIGLWFLPDAPEEGFRRFAAVLLVACPCIFGFGAPMVISRAFQLGIGHGIIFRNQKALEGLSQVESFYFDKTGTLTDEEAEISRLRWNEENLRVLSRSHSEVLNMLLSLSGMTRHHVPKTLGRWAQAAAASGSLEAMRIDEVREFFGSGISFQWGPHQVRLGRQNFCMADAPAGNDEQGWTLLCLDDLEILRLTLEEELKPDASFCVDRLIRDGRSVHILSGDSSRRVHGVGTALKLPAQRIASNLTPADKLKRIAGPRTAMVGNGINDVLASSGATIGIALANASDSMKSASDIVFVRQGISPLLLAMDLSAETKRVMQRCFALALTFNLVAMSLALSGLVTPAMAAVLMPVSSISVFFSSQAFRLRRVC